MIVWNITKQVICSDEFEALDIKCFVTIIMANRSSLADKLKSISKCDICFEEYNRQDKQPVIICTMHHTVCRACMRDLESTRKCPFCRETINFSKIVVNNYIFQLLPSDPVQPNTRTAIPAQPVQSIQPRFAPPAEPVRQAPVSVNYQQPQPVYPPNYVRQPSEDDYVFHGPPPGFMYIQQDQSFQSFQCGNCLQNVQQRLELHRDSDRKGIYICIFILQFPYMFFDLLISLTATDPKCMDTPYANRAYILRPWMLAMGITEASIMAFLLFGVSLRLCQLISITCLTKFEFICIGILVIKILLWLYMELALFAAVIQPHCSGGVYAYGLIQTIIHGIFLLFLFCLSACK